LGADFHPIVPFMVNGFLLFYFYFLL
jgi:hypothetical protein